MIDICTSSINFFAALKRSYPGIELAVPETDLTKYGLVIFPGGGDISPEIYHEKNTHSFPDKKRDEIELKILENALKLGKKVLGICRGHQLINAYLGGKMIQDLYYDLGKSHPPYHHIDVIVETPTTNIFKLKGVNSLHHQGVIEPGENLHITSIFNGVSESIEGENIITVQFHPEFMESKESALFFKYILEWAKEN